MLIRILLTLVCLALAFPAAAQTTTPAPAPLPPGRAGTPPTVPGGQPGLTMPQATPLPSDTSLGRMHRDMAARRRAEERSQAEFNLLGNALRRRDR